MIPLKSQRGFTLLEVLIALAMFVAVAMALDSAMSANVRGQIRYEEKTLATWVAANKLVELQVYQKWPEPGRQDDESEFAGQRWFVQTNVSDGPFPGTRKVVIGSGRMPAEALGEKQAIATLSALLVQPQAPVSPPGPRGAGGERGTGEGAGEGGGEDEGNGT